METCCKRSNTSAANKVFAGSVPASPVLLAMQVILHWHGPKAERCLNCYIELWEQSKSDKSIVQQCGCPSAYDTLWNLAMDADQAALYRSAVQDHAKYADTLDDEIATLAAY